MPVPEKTRTYAPVGFGELADLVHERLDSYLGLKVLDETYGLSRNDTQLFGVIKCEMGLPQHALAIGVRSSHDKSLSVGFASGASVFVCDNLCFSGAGTTFVRKHTTNVWRDIVNKVDRTLGDAVQNFERTLAELDKMADIPLSLDDGYDLIGRGLGYDILAPQQATIALKDWRTPRHIDFEDRNLHSLYQCFTEALKKGTAGKALDRHTSAHDWFNSMLPAPPKQISLG